MNTCSISLPIDAIATYTDIKKSNISLPIETSMNFSTYKAAEVITIPSQEATYILPAEGSSSWLSDNFYRSFINLNNLWGTSSNDTHFVNSTHSGSTGNVEEDLFKNVNHHEPDYVFEMVGDVEIQSSSFGEDGLTKVVVDGTAISTNFPVTDHTVISIFGNRKVIDKGEGYTYKSYVKTGGNIEGPQDGRPVGKTSYFITGSGASDIIYPSNHWIHFSEDNYRTQMYAGTKCSNLTFQSTEFEDYTSSCAYTVKVEQVDELRPSRGIGTISSEGTISY